MHQIERMGSKRLITTAMHVACCNISVHIVINRLLFHRRNITCNKSYTPLLVIAPAAVGRVSSSFRSQRFADINEIIHLSVRVCVSTIYLSAFPLPSVLFFRGPATVPRRSRSMLFTWLATHRRAGRSLWAVDAVERDIRPGLYGIMSLSDVVLYDPRASARRRQRG